MATSQGSVRVQVRVAAPLETAFRVFTEGFATWWPMATHHIGRVAAATAVIEPRVGGRWYERGQDGSECDWGVVRAWEPPARLVLAWQIDADWRYDPACETTVEIRFVSETPDQTRVEVEHRDLDRFGARRDEMRGTLGGEGGWPSLVELFRKRAEGQ